MEEKVSLIVPVYNSEKYLNECLISLVNQTYKNLEIIIIDNGSTDNSPQIYNSFCKKDSRIKVIRQENKGVSAARNTALKIATGSRICFVDSDDFIAEDTIFTLLNTPGAAESDIIIFGRDEFYEDSHNIILPPNNPLTKESALNLLFEDNIIKNYMCDKMWKRGLFTNIKYPERRVYEDISTAYLMFYKANSFLCVQKPFYNYRQHSTSIIHTKSIENQADFVIALSERFVWSINNYPAASGVLYTQCVNAISDFMCLFSKAKLDKSAATKQKAQTIKAFINTQMLPALYFNKLGRYNKICLNLAGKSLILSAPIIKRLNKMQKKYEANANTSN